MRAETDPAKIERFLQELGRLVLGPGRVYLTGGATALLLGWRQRTVDIDIKLDPEPPGAFAAIAALKDRLDVNVELASPDDFLPPLPGWRDRSLFIGRYGEVDCFHYDPHAQALSKIERGHARDLADVRAMLARGLVDPAELRRLLSAIEPELVRYPAVEAATLREQVEAVLGGG